MPAVSEAKLNANRANAQLSTGPKSAEGKSKVSLNAVKTGLTGRTVLLPSDDVAVYQAVVLRFTERWTPETEEERILVQSLADNDWRLQRIPVLEFGIFAIGERELADKFADETDPQVRHNLIQTKIFISHRRELTNLQTQESRLRRQRLEDEERLRDVQSRRKRQEIEKGIEARQAAQRSAPTPAAQPAPQPAAPPPPQRRKNLHLGFDLHNLDELALTDPFYAHMKAVRAENLKKEQELARLIEKNDRRER